MFCTLCITLNACSGGGGSGAGGSSNSNNQQQQSPDNGAENLTPSEIANVEACKEKLQITIVENGSSRSATPGEIAAQGYLISKKCGFSEAELELYLKIQGY
ncbi:MAG: hypothetical protein QE271_04900 [Bacteriovoracaceae bacterium]|nr:hypothetical protein [Bacteriovoracaceae bacterium]